MKTIIIGDVHGCYSELLALLEKAELSVSEDRLIFIGDLIDRGSDPYMSLRHALDLRKEMGERCVLIRGNHEQMMLDSIHDPASKPLWHMNGASKTIKSFYRHGKTPAMAREWIESMQLYYETEDFICAHAGVDSRGPEMTDPDTFLWDRDIAELGCYSGKFFVYGHTPIREAVYQDGSGNFLLPCEADAPRSLPAAGSIDIDTGCVFGNKLTALVIEGKTFCIRSVEAAKKENLLS